MLKRFLKFLFISLSVILLLSTSSFATTEIKVPEVGDKFIVEDIISVDNSVDGNVFAMGSNITINDSINGDLFVLADTLVINPNAKIDGTIFALANTITVNGTADAIYAIGDLFELTSVGGVLREIHLIGSNVKINGNIYGNAYLDFTNLSIETGHINGDLYYSSNSELTGLSSKVSGSIFYEEIIEEEPETKNFSSYLKEFISVLIFAALVWFVLSKLTPSFLNNSAEMFNGFNKKVFGTIGYGLLALILIPILVIILMFTGITLNISISSLSIYIFFIALSGTIFRAILITSVLNKNNFTKTSQKIACIILVTLVTYVLTLIPYVGFYVKLAYVILVLGFILRNVKNLIFKQRKNRSY